ncbi:unnamed protein product [Blumeria hordei]|uniref:Uncharacterized protein n=1 Tax=Blumeria hordei TaxID=2867405 RepID=A0A383UZR1_BLUHO|nr:unnamed protein product [Blumeria hordei]
MLIDGMLFGTREPLNSLKSTISWIESVQILNTMKLALQLGSHGRARVRSIYIETKKIRT